MDNEITMPIHSHCINDIELHDETEKCAPANYYAVEDVSYQVLVGYDDMLLGCHLDKGSRHIMTKQRAMQIINTNQGLIKIVKET